MTNDDKEYIRLGKLVDKAIKGYRGQIDKLESAIGMLFAGRKFGWKVIYPSHDCKTVRKYKSYLGIDVRKIQEVAIVQSVKVASQSSWITSRYFQIS